jgi:hypothetical protein
VSLSWVYVDQPPSHKFPVSLHLHLAPGHCLLQTVRLRCPRHIHSHPGKGCRLCHQPATRATDRTGCSTGQRHCTGSSVQRQGTTLPAGAHQGAAGGVEGQAGAVHTHGRAIGRFNQQQSDCNASSPSLNVSKRQSHSMQYYYRGALRHDNPTSLQASS